MTFADSLSLHLIMITLAAIPSSSFALVVVRSATLGVRNGVAAALGDVKAILFYAALFPVFVDVSALTSFDVAVIGAITLIGVKLAHAVAARAITAASQGSPFRRPVRMAAGTLMIGTGGHLIAKGCDER